MPKIPPQDRLAEQSVLGAVMIDPDAIARVADLVRPEDFYEESHRVIFDAALGLFKNGKPIDLLTISSALKSAKKLTAAGGETYLAELTDTVPTAFHAPQYAKIVREKSTLRGLARAGDVIRGLSDEEAKPLSETLDRAEKAIFEVTQAHLREGFVPVSKVISDVYDRLAELQESGGELRGISTSLPRLDKKLAGWQRGDLVIIAARPSVGKTTLSLQFATHAALREKLSVGFFSLEMSKEQLVERMFANLLGVNLHKLRTGEMSESDFAKMGEVMDTLDKAPLFFDDSAECRVTDIRAKCRRLQMEHGLDMVIVDYLQLIQGDNPMNRVQEISEISRGLKSLARELKVPVLALSQLSRTIESRSDKVPQLSDLRDSGSIEQDADVVIMISREDVYEQDPRNHTGIVDLFIRKHRNGPTGLVKVKLNAKKMKFAELSDQEYRDYGFDGEE